MSSICSKYWRNYLKMGKDCYQKQLWLNSKNFKCFSSTNSSNKIEPADFKKSTRNSLYYAISLGVIAIGFTFAAIPAYRIFCETTSFGGLTQISNDFEKIEKMERVKDRLIQVQFNADVPSSMQWSFKPLQNEIYVYPGETALAFFTAKNPTDKPIIGISSYNLTPFQAAYYFNKIQCFCFEEQILNPGEEVDLPVFFYIDPDFVNDPFLENLDQLLLSYTFFESKANVSLPSPFDPNNRPLNRKSVSEAKKEQELLTGTHNKITKRNIMAA